MWFDLICHSCSKVSWIFFISEVCLIESVVLSMCMVATYFNFSGKKTNASATQRAGSYMLDQLVRLCLEIVTNDVIDLGHLDMEPRIFMKHATISISPWCDEMHICPIAYINPRDRWTFIHVAPISVRFFVASFHFTNQHKIPYSLIIAPPVQNSFMLYASKTIPRIVTNCKDQYLVSLKKPLSFIYL